MARATLIDIAQVAGVSTATVDRALNSRPGVSATNRQRVMSAARTLGYVPSDGMVILPARPARLEFLFPMGQIAFMREVASNILRVAKDHPLVESCTIIPLGGIGPDAFTAGLDHLSPGTEGVGIITTDHPKSRDAIRRLSASGVRVVTIASDVQEPSRSAYIGVDNMISGRTAAQILGMLAGRSAGAAAVFLGSRAFKGHQEREAGFLACLSERSPNLRILPSIETNEDSGRVRSEMAKLLRSVPDLAAVYCVGAGRKGIVEALEERPSPQRPAVVLHDLTDNARVWLAQDKIDAVIDQNASLVAQQAVLRLLGAIASTNALLPLHHIEPRIILRENIPAERPPR